MPIAFCPVVNPWQGWTPKAISSNPESLFSAFIVGNPAAPPPPPLPPPAWHTQWAALPEVAGAWLLHIQSG